MKAPRWHQGLGFRLISSFLLGVTIMLMLLFFAESSLREAIRDTQRLLDGQLIPLVEINDLQAELLKLREKEVTLVRVRDEFALVNQAFALEADSRDFDQQLHQVLEALPAIPALQIRLLEEGWQAYRQDLDELLTAAAAKRPDQALDISVYQSTSSFQNLINAFQTFSWQRQQQSEDIYSLLLERRDWQFHLFLWIALVSLVLLGGLLAWVTLGLLKRLLLLRDGARELALTNRPQPLDDQGQDELAQLAQAFNLLQTRIKSREEALQQAQASLEERVNERTAELRASNAELEQFAYVASHDLRQPLRMITSYLKLLEKRLDSQLDEEARVMMDFASDGARRLDQMLVSLLEYSRVGRKGQPRRWLASREALNEALIYLRPDIEARGAEIIIEGESWPQVYASHDELTRLFQNLVGNALKYHAGETPPSIHIQVRTLENRHEFSVQDQGIGIQPNMQDRLFQVFQRLHTQQEYEGSGVGLAVCRKIVEGHGGHIWVESQGKGEGSRFTFTLPLAPAKNKVDE
ncbi:sensor histidine kinase [Marinospirillum perlucidum]|uniref:sensor histidine kinase n=1 Tax=Marinospirillum perlucidum TaxID=1982602 RepID=UPI000DF25C29|nr:ATP-binding protein [Marinospirillum perlucidum]